MTGTEGVRGQGSVELEEIANGLTEQSVFAQIIGRSEAIRLQIETVGRYARRNSAVLICGETGSGKEVLAQAIHHQSSRSSHPFVPLNCAGIPLELVENELFGHEQGAFTGATGPRAGLIEAADGGSLFLDEIDSLPILAQAKFLRFLQEQEYRRLGATASRRVDVRVISASNRDLLEAVANGQFRKDLYYRLNVLILTVPPLREHREDIPLLAEHLLLRHSRPGGSPATRLDPSATRKLMEYDWPGNVRELENVLVRAQSLSEGPTIKQQCIDFGSANHARPAGSCRPTGTFNKQKDEVVREFERGYLKEVLLRNHGNITQAATEAGKDRRTFFGLLKKHGLTTFRSQELPAATGSEYQI